MISKHIRTEQINADPYNKLGKRNVRNTNYRKYNCGGYALGIFSWYLPDGSKYYGSDDEEERVALMQKCVEGMLEEFPDLRVINSIDELRADEYAIAFRLSDEDSDDFHFVRRGRNGVWYQKRGNKWCIDTMPKEEVFSESWGGIYFGDITLFAKPFPKKTLKKMRKIA